jgi:hypothetical protein
MRQLQPIEAANATVLNAVRSERRSRLSDDFFALGLTGAHPTLTGTRELQRVVAFYSSRSFAGDREGNAKNACHLRVGTLPCMV